MADEATSLLAKITGAPDSPSPFLSAGDITDGFKVDRRRILAILSSTQLACGLKSTRDALSSAGSSSVSSATASVSLRDLVGRLLRLASFVSEDIGSEGFEDIKVAVQAALEASTNLQSVSDFADAIAPLLTGESLKVRRRTWIYDGVDAKIDVALTAAMLVSGNC